MENKANNKSSDPLVSVYCIVYNQERYVRKCFNGFVNQKTNFRFEVIVHDDASTDGTTSILNEYAEKYPDLIKPIIEVENQYSKHDDSINKIMYPRLRGKYVAVCEGDDYWIDPQKLQKQYDFLENHPEYLMCYTDFDINNYETGEYFESVFKNYPQEYPYLRTLDNWLVCNSHRYVAPMTWMVRKEYWVQSPKYQSLDGTFLRFAYYLAIGKVYCLINENTAVYGIHKGSASHQSSVQGQYVRLRNLLDTSHFIISNFISQKDQTFFFNSVDKAFYQDAISLIVYQNDKDVIDKARLYNKENGFTFRSRFILLCANNRLLHSIYSFVFQKYFNYKQ